MAHYFLFESKMDIIQQLFQIYDNYKERLLTHRRYSHSDLMLVLKKFDKSNVIKKNLLGTSVENRQIFLYKIGNGKKKVLLWSQMHGDESTATSAFVDLFNFFEDSSKKLFIKEKILQELTLYFIPMLNPDGAERLIRFNAQGIDINRDAKSLQSPEAKILLKAVEDFKPDFAFNMHDQDYRWSVGGNDKVVALSFLAPAFDAEKTINPARERTINLLSEMINFLGDYTENRITRYSDDFEPRSFGDTIAGRGISTILVEAGRWQNDLEKSYLRKLNFLVLLFAMSRIAENSIVNDSRKYFDTPYNGKFLFDLILRKVKLKINSTESIVDIAINREFHFDDNDRSAYYVSSVEAVGDLSPFYGIEEINCENYSLHFPKYLDESSKLNYTELNREVIVEYLQNDILFLSFNDFSRLDKYVRNPINVIRKEFSLEEKLIISKPANFILKEDNINKYIIINGFLIDHNNINFESVNGLFL